MNAPDPDFPWNALRAEAPRALRPDLASRVAQRTAQRAAEAARLRTSALTALSCVAAVLLWHSLHSASDLERHASAWNEVLLAADTVQSGL